MENTKYKYYNAQNHWKARQIAIWARAGAGDKFT